MQREEQKFSKRDVDFYLWQLWRHGGMLAVVKSTCKDDLNKHLKTKYHLTSKQYNQLVEHVENELKQMQTDFIYSQESVSPDDPNYEYHEMTKEEIEEDIRLTLESVSMYKEMSPREFWLHLNSKKD